MSGTSVSGPGTPVGGGAPLRQQAAKGVAWTTLMAVGSRAMTAVVFVVLARLLTPAEIGLVALALVFISLTSMFVDQGFGSALVQRRELDDEHLDTAFWTTLGSGVLLAGALCGLAYPISSLVGAPDLVPVLQALSATLVLGATASAPTSVLRRELGFRSLAYRKLLGTFVGGVAGVAAAFGGWGVWALVAQAVTQQLVATVALWAVTPYRPGLRFSRAAFRDLFGYSNKVIGIKLLEFLSKRSDDLLIGSVLGPVALGLYSVAYRLLTIMTEVLNLTIDGVAFPTFARLQGDVPRMRRAYESAIRASLTVAAPAYLAVAVLAPDLVALFFGERWDDAVPVMQVLALAGLVQALLYSNNSLLMAIGRPQTVLRVTAVIAAVNVVGFLVAVNFGILAVAVAYAVRAYLLAPLSIAPAKRALGFSWREFVVPLLPLLLSGGLMAGAVALVRHVLLADAPTAVALGASLAVAALTYPLLVRLLAPARFREVVGYAALALPSRRRRAGARGA
ncbi:lipopolysaccharide biosynthesis protein [Vallicoccus soli]|uniref:Lipopolysaccharide biosynthesis protein n=1 Tax=Vallicoccus soli TaxID=2339232 RepID=A0A3A3ZMK5_9ACTN|nr:lipopolysaccharide biosynthesis protein [Vallicoccus soli]RJK97881.1 lipopolysaccharide biosynthesis protein [Vallicoccus soli]